MSVFYSRQKMQQIFETLIFFKIGHSFIFYVRPFNCSTVHRYKLYFQFFTLHFLHKIVVPTNTTCMTWSQYHNLLVSETGIVHISNLRLKQSA